MSPSTPPSDPPSPGDPWLEARDLVRHGDEGEMLLDRVCLTLRAGEAVALQGASGSGKTLLLRSLALVDALDGGEVRFRGEPVADDDVPAFRSRVVLALQEPALFAGTVRENLERPFQLRVHAHRRFDSDRVSDLLTRLDRDPAILERRADDLSGGERRLVSLVRILQLEPDVLLLDEPTAGLDSETAARLEQVVASYLDEHPSAALLWVGHDLQQAARMTTRRLRIEHGRLRGEDP